MLFIKIKHKAKKKKTNNDNIYEPLLYNTAEMILSNCSEWSTGMA